MVSVVCIKTNHLIVLEAACLTLTVVLAITYYAMTTTTDFTLYGPVLTIISWVVCVAGMLYSVFGYHKSLLWSVGGVILFSFYLLFDTQMIMGGDNKRYQFDEDSYILAAVAIYLDIINLFLYILEILDDGK